MDKRYIHIISQDNASLGEVTNDIIAGLKEDFIITEEVLGEVPLKKDILLCHFVTPKIVSHDTFNDFRHKVLIFPVDGTSLTEEYTYCLNKFDYIITPAEAGKKILLKNGIVTPIKVIPNFWKYEHFLFLKNIKQKKLDREIKNKFVFYYEANYYPRKGFEELILNYIEEFSSNEKEEPVVLLLKTDNTLKAYEYFENLKDEIFKLQKTFKYPAKVVKISQYIKFEELRKIWQKVNCYVHPSRIEGFGIPLLRMALLNKPIIVLDNKLSGYNDFLEFCDDVKYVSCNKIVAENEINKAYSEKSEWCIADNKDFKNILRNTFIRHSNREQSKLINFNLDCYNYNNIIKEYISFFYNLNNKNLFEEVKLGNKVTQGIKYICPRGNSGYASAAKDYIIGINDVNIPIEVEYFIFDDTNSTEGKKNKIVNLLSLQHVNYNKVIIHTVPEFWPEIIKTEKNNNPNVEVIGMTVWETDSLDKNWVKWINQVDKVIVPCELNKDVFLNCGVIKPIEVIPHIFKKSTAPSFSLINPLQIENINDDFVYYTIGQWTNRKGIEDTIKAYLNTFDNKDKTCLIVKTFKNNFSEIEKEKIRNRVNSLLDKYKNPAKVILLLDEYSEDQIESLHNLGDCYFSLCKAEGWGLGAFAAAGKGKPVIITGFGGQLDYLIEINKELLVNYELIPVTGMGWIAGYNSNQQWAQPDLNHASMLLEKVKNDPSILSTINRCRRRDYIINNYNSEIITKKLINFLNK